MKNILLYILINLPLLSYCKADTVSDPTIASITFSNTICDGSLTDINLTLVNATGFFWNATLINISNEPSVFYGNETNINQILTLYQPSVNGYRIIQIRPYNSVDNTLGPLVTIQITVIPNPQVVLENGTITIDQSSGAVTSPFIIDSGLSSSDYSFEWYHNNILINGSNGSTHTATQSGDYYVVATNLSVGCIGISNVATVSENTMSTENFLLNQNFSIYPNPVQENLNVVSRKSNIISIELFNLSGQLIKYYNVNNAEESKIDVSLLQSGIYFVQINTKEGNEILKFAKQKP